VKKILIYVFLLFLFSEIAIAIPVAKITVKVIDEQANPVAGAKVWIGFRGTDSKSGGPSMHPVSGLTDGEGLFTGEGETTSYFTFSAEKEGYYATSNKFYDFTEVTGFYGFRKYEPWNPTLTLVLKKIINPISMYAVRTSGGREGEYPEVPEIGRFIGYDLIVKDWVVPYGLGTHRDFLFKIDVEKSISNRDYDVTFILKFSNPGDGLVKYTPDTSKGKSALRLPHHAPVSGYEVEYVQHYEGTPGEIKIGVSGDPDFDNNYFFRVRTELDDDGNVVGGLYGKVHGSVELGNYAWLHIEKPYLSFNYYLNPNNNDTNIEYDLEKNLFKGVPHRLRVIQP